MSDLHFVDHLLHLLSQQQQQESILKNGSQESTRTLLQLVLCNGSRGRSFTKIVQHLFDKWNQQQHQNENEKNAGKDVEENHVRMAVLTCLEFLVFDSTSPCRTRSTDNDNVSVDIDEFVPQFMGQVVWPLLRGELVQAGYAKSGDKELAIRLCQLVSQRIIDDTDSPLVAVLQECDRFFTTAIVPETGDELHHHHQQQQSDAQPNRCFAMVNMLSHILKYDQDKGELSATLKDSLFHAVIDGFRENVVGTTAMRWLSRNVDENSLFELRKVTLQLLLPKFLHDSEGVDTIKERLQHIWMLVQDIYDRFKLGANARRNNNGTGNSAERLQAYALMCLFYDKFFHPELTKRAHGEWFDVRTEESFWQLIMSGLNDEESSPITKRSLFLLKRVIDSSNDLGERGNSGKKWTRFFQFDYTLAKQWNRAWELFILIHESLDQHSSHLIRPIWHDLYDLFPRYKDASAEIEQQQNGKSDKKKKKQKDNTLQGQKSQNLQTCYLDFCWVEKLFLKALKHSNFGVHRMALMSLFQLDFHVYDYQYLDKNFLSGSLIDHMNETKLYFNKHTRVGPYAQSFFHEYLKSLESDDERSEFIASILRKLRGDLRLTKISLVNWLKVLATYNPRTDKSLNMLSLDDLRMLHGILDHNVNLHQPWLMYRMQSLVLETIMRLSQPKTVSMEAILQLLQEMDFEQVVCHPTLLASIRHWITTHPEWHLYVTNALSNLVRTAFSQQVSFEESATSSTRFAILVVIVLPLLGGALFSNQVLMPLTDSCSKIYKHTHLDESVPSKAIFMAKEILNKCCLLPEKINGVSIDNRRQLTSAIVMDNLEGIISHAENIVNFPKDIDTLSTELDIDNVSQFDISIHIMELFCEVNAVVRNSDIVDCIHTITERSLTFIRDLSPQMQTEKSIQASFSYNRFLLLAFDLLNVLLKNKVACEQEIASSRTRLLDVLLAVLDVHILGALGERHVQKLRKGLTLSPSQISSVMREAQFENVSIMLLQFVRKHDGLQFLSQEENQHLRKRLLSTSLEALDVMHMEGAYLLFDIVRLLSPLIADDDIESTATTLMACVRQIGRKSELHCYENLCATMTNLFIRRSLSKNLSRNSFDEEFFNHVLVASHQAQRPLISLAFHLCSSILGYINGIERDNDTFVLSLPEKIIKLLISANDKEVNEDEELEMCEITTQDTAYVTGMPQSTTIYPSIFKVSRIVNAIIFSFYDRLNGMEDESGFCDQFIRQTFVDTLDEIVLIEAKGGANSMPGSQGHKQKLRLWKLLNWIIPSIKISSDNSEIEEFKTKMWKLLKFPNMSSVRRLMELFMVALALKFEWVVYFLEECMGSFNERAQVLSSLSIIAGNVIRYCSDEKIATYFRILFPRIEQCTHTHQYMLRVSCQLMFVKIYQELLNPTDESIGFVPSANVLRRSELFKQQTGIGQDMIQQWHNTYEFVHNSSNTLKFIKKHEDGFVLDPFNISKPPKLISTPIVQDTSSLDNPELIDDYVPMHLFDILQSPDGDGNKVNSLIMSLCFTSESNSGWNIRDLTEQWRSLNPYAKGSKRTPMDYPVQSPLQHLESLYSGTDEMDLVSKDRRNNIFQTEDGEDSQIYQRKIETWKQMSFETELSTTKEQEFVNHAQSIIVVASLVDNWTNLAGLSRTSEIFRAESICVNNLDIVKKNPDFRSISVGAEKWVPIQEVPIEEVRAFCMEKKSQGYTIMGLEQTSSSTPLQHVTFPDKVVLILGREKTGIPTEMLEFVDLAVEIPQLGVLRSLNVHVSASIMLFEYTRQQILKKQN